MKPHFVAEAAELNPFASEYFVWMDIGAIRDYGGVEATDFAGKASQNIVRERGRAGGGGSALLCAVFTRASR